MTEKLCLKYMVVPERLAEMAYVDDPVMVRISDPESVFLMGILGESGRKLVASGIEFYFTRELAQRLIDHGVAELAE